MPVIDPSELIGHTFLMDKEDRQQHCAQILDVIDEEEICKCIGEHKREHKSLMLLMKRRFVNVLANTNMNSSGNLDTYNLFALSMMTTTKRSFPTMS
jgi:hypothetical protein